MSRNIPFVLMYHRHKILDLKNLTFIKLKTYLRMTIKVNLSIYLIKYTAWIIMEEQRTDRWIHDLGTAWRWVVNFTLRSL
jgi:hypothetical protein